jgi:hypothetical protein
MIVSTNTHIVRRLAANKTLYSGSARGLTHGFVNRRAPNVVLKGDRA